MERGKQTINTRKLPEFLFSNFVFIFNFKEKVCLYHSLLIKKIFLTKEEFKTLRQLLIGGNIKDTDLIYKLYEKGFLIKNKKEDSLLYKKAQELVKNWELKTLFLVVTDKCNFKCKYCFENLEKYSKSKMMSEETAKKAITTFARETKKSKTPKTIFFYGGNLY